jgi:hypothetical protein
LVKKDKKRTSQTKRNQVETNENWLQRQAKQDPNGGLSLRDTRFEGSVMQNLQAVSQKIRPSYDPINFTSLFARRPINTHMTGIIALIAFLSCLQPS